MYMSDREVFNPELAYAWAQETLAEHEANGGERPFQLVRVNNIGKEVEAVVELPNPGGDPYLRSARVMRDGNRTHEFYAFQAVTTALEDDFPQAATIRSEIADVQDSGYLVGDQKELLLIPEKGPAYNSHGQGEMAKYTALEEGVASLLLIHQA
jgi:hypothetical protein